MDYREYILIEGKMVRANDYIFESLGFENKPITRIQAFRIIKRAAEACNISGVVSCHSLRKTFGYHAWQ